MKFYSRLPFLAALILLISGELAMANSAAKAGGSAHVPDSKNQIIKLTDSGVSPDTLTMKREDSIVFFLNQTRESLATVEIDFGDKHTHCSSGNLSIIDGGKIASIRPFGPDDFSSTCFHDAGTYTYKVLGLSKNPAGITGKIIVK